MKTKLLVKEWKQFIENELLIEISLKKLKDKFPEAEIDYNLFPSKLKGNVRYLDVIKNTLEDEEQRNPSTEEFIKQFNFFIILESLLRKDKKSLTLYTPKTNDFHSILHKFKDEEDRDNITATFKDIEDWKNKRIGLFETGSDKEKINYFQEVASSGEGHHFNLITETPEWAVYKPNTIAGSKSLCRSYWNGTNLEVDETFKINKSKGEKIGEMRWCTNAAGSGNYFYSYNNNTKFLIYFIKKSQDGIVDPEDRFRKVCAGFEIIDSNTMILNSGSGTVDGNNTLINSNILKENVTSNIPNVISLIKKSFIDKYENFTIDDLNNKKELFKEKIKLASSVEGANKKSIIKNFIREIEPAFSLSREKNEIFEALLELNNKTINNLLLINKNCTTQVLTKITNLIVDDISELYSEDYILNMSGMDEQISSDRYDGISNSRDTVKTILKHRNCDRNIVLLLYNSFFKTAKESKSSMPGFYYDLFSVFVKSPHTSENIRLEIFADNKDESFLSEFIRYSSNIQKDVLMSISDTNNLNVLRDILYDKNTDKEIVTHIVTNSSDEERQKVIVSDASLTCDHLLIMISHGNWEICKRILKKYKRATKFNAIIRKVFTTFVGDGENREVVVELLNYNLPRDILGKIGRMSDIRLVERAIEKYNFPSEVLVDILDNTSNKDLVQHIMSQNKDLDVERKIAYLRDESVHIYNRLEVLLASDNLGFNLFKSFFNENIQKYGLGLEDLDFEWLEFFYLLKDKICNDRRRILFFIEILENSEFETLLSVLFTSIKCPPEILDYGSESKDTEIRLAVAENGNTEKSVLETLAADEDSYVSDAAKDTLSMLESNIISNLKNKKLNERLIIKYIKFYL